MKPLSRQQKQMFRLEVSSKGKSKPLHCIKTDALRASASSLREPVEDSREAFGFFPKGLQGVVIRWPAL